MKSIFVVLMLLACVFAATEAVSSQCQTWFKNTCKYYDGATNSNRNSVMQDALNHYQSECGSN